MKVKIIIIVAIFLLISIGTSETAFSSKEIIINESNYNDYFESNGNIKNVVGGIEENDTLKLSNLNNKNITIDRKVTIDRENENSVFSNGYIKITTNSDGTKIQNLKIIGTYNPTSSSDTKSILSIENSGDNTIQGVFFNISRNPGTLGTLNCIYIGGLSLNNQIINSQFYVNSLSESGWSYGIVLSSNNIYNTLIYGNTINMKSKNFVQSISTSAKNTTIEKNSIYLYSPLIYGVYVNSYAIDTKILNNNIIANGEIYYLIEVYQGYNTTVANNVLNGTGNGGFAFACKFSQYDTITRNNITLFGTNVGTVKFYTEDIKGHCGIYYAGYSGDAVITNNRIISLYNFGGDYAIKSESSIPSSTYTIVDNYLVSDYGKKLGNGAISMDLTGTYLLNGPETFEFPKDEKEDKSQYTPDNPTTPPVPEYSVIKIKNSKAVKKKVVTFKTTLANLGPNKANFKVTYKLAKGFTYKKPKVSVGITKYNKKTRTLTWTVNNLKVHKTKSATLTMSLKAKKGKYTLKAIVKNSNSLKVSSNNVLKGIKVK
jgi:hypothetical protein